MADGGVQVGIGCAVRGVGRSALLPVMREHHADDPFSSCKQKYAERVHS
jgi:hypothetical protein